VQQSQPLRIEPLGEKIYPGDVAAGPIEASDEAERHRVTADTEDDRNRRGRLLCGSAPSLLVAKSTAT
jgi:hypothetical protein